MQRLFCAALFLAAALGAQESSVLERDFGKPGDPGAMRVRFYRQGGDIFSLHLLDHFYSVEAKHKTERSPGDYMLLVHGGSDGDPSLELRQDRASSLFTADELTGKGWQVEDGADAVTFRLASQSGVVLSKTWRHHAARRELSLEIGLELPADKVKPAVGEVALLLSGPILVNAHESSILGNPAVAIVVAGDTPVVDRPAAGKARNLFTAAGQPTWQFAGTSNRFFGAYQFPVGEAAERSLTAIEVATRGKGDAMSKTAPNSVEVMSYAFRMPVPEPGQRTAVTFGNYFGPKSFKVFDAAPELARFRPVMDVDLEPPCFCTVPGGRFMAVVLLKLLGFFDGLIGSWGVAIVMLTILVRGLLSPLNFRMQKSMRAYGARMAVLQPKMHKLKEQYKDDPKGYQAAMIQFQREHKLLPPLGGCLPIFLTMPVYLGLFSALRVAYDLRHEGFIGWIDDLSQPDALFELGWSFAPYFNLLPLLWMGLFIWMSLRQPLPTDPQQRQMQQMMRYMPLLFGVFLYNYASGLMLYMVTSMVWSLVESSVIKKILGPVDPNVQAMAPAPMM